MNIIGIHRGHNAAVALLRNSELIFAVQEERLTRVKNQGGLPAYGLKAAIKGANGIAASNLSAGVALAGKAMVRTEWKRDDQLGSYGATTPDLTNRIRGVVRRSKVLADTIDKRKRRALESEVGALLGGGSVKIDSVEHHLCHASSGYFGWGKMNDKILILTCDGSGDGICASVNVGYRGKIERLAQVEQTHSIGRLYANVTYLLGMVPMEHEYKLMGLAPYAERSGEAVDIAEKVGSLFEFHRQNPLQWSIKNCEPMQYASGFLAELFRRRRFDHVAAGLQIFTEKFLVQWVKNCIRETGIKKVALSGGVFMNVKANQKILEIPEIEELYIFPSCGDETNAIGSGWHLYHRLTQEFPAPLNDLYLGDQFTSEEAEEAIRAYRFQSNVKVVPVSDMEKKVAELLAANEIVARFKGRMEFGARALGNRSILANPSNSKAVRVINEMIKCRDFWMPFAPSVIAEDSDKYFIKPKPMEAPYMIITFPTREEKIEKIISALHPYDHTARPQEVKETWNPSYYSLLRHFESLTGESVVLNTSFNLHGEPVVRTPEDALRVFDISGLQHLAIENFLLRKN